MLTKIVLLACSMLFLCALNSRADVIYLRNGRTIEGFIQDEKAEPILIDIGFGIIGLKRGEIESFSRSGEKDAQRLRDRWDRQKKESEERNRQQKIQDQLALKQRREAEDARKKKEFESKQIKIGVDGGHIIVTALLNNKVSASFVLDTGSPFTVIKDSIARQLGINSGSISKSMKIRLGGKESVAKHTVLSSVSLQGIEAVNVDALIISDDAHEGDFKDGLLGLTFLNNFSFKIDQKNKILVLEKL